MEWAKKGLNNKSFGEQKLVWPWLIDYRPKDVEVAAVYFETNLLKFNLL